MPRGIYPRKSPEQRFWPLVRKTDHCWEWLGRLDRGGYPQFKLGGRRIMAHRFAYELLVGPIPKGMELDHVKARGCTNRHCVNPAHMEIVTHRVNTLRGDNPLAINARKTHCKHGHAFTTENLYPRRDGARECRECKRYRASRPHRAERAAA